MRPSPLIRLSLCAALCAMAALLCVASHAQERKATPEEAVAMVKQAVAAIRKEGTQKAYAQINDRKGRFVVRDLYIAVYDLGGTVHAHGGNNNMVGKNLIDLRDIDGKAFVRERVELARKNESFWHDYQFTHPETRKIEPKRMYCERLNDTVVCGGIYK
jgi:signal transduction histidine kinase